MSKLILLSGATTLLLIILLSGCTDFDDCYTCQKRSGGYYSSIGWVTEYKRKLACSDKEADKFEKDGWDCVKDNSRSVNVIGPGDDNVKPELFVTVEDTTCQCSD